MKLRAMSARSTPSAPWSGDCSQYWAACSSWACNSDSVHGRGRTGRQPVSARNAEASAPAVSLIWSPDFNIACPRPLFFVPSILPNTYKSWRSRCGWRMVDGGWRMELSQIDELNPYEHPCKRSVLPLFENSDLLVRLLPAQLTNFRGLSVNTVTA